MNDTTDELYQRHSDLVMKYFSHQRMSVKEIVELAHVRKKLGALQMKEMFGNIMNDFMEQR
jgi:hypothetical protein